MREAPRAAPGARAAPAGWARRGGTSANGAGGTPGATNGNGESTTTSAQIRAWVLANCTAVTDSSVTGLYSCGS
ncbi:hypothetical protein [Microbacterium lacticum]